jgi:hypothetical protein
MEYYRLNQNSHNHNMNVNLLTVTERLLNVVLTCLAQIQTKKLRCTNTMKWKQN